MKCETTGADQHLRRDHRRQLCRGRRGLDGDRACDGSPGDGGDQPRPRRDPHAPDQPPVHKALLRKRMGHRPAEGVRRAAGGPRVVFARLQAFLKGKGREAGGQAYPGACVGGPALGRPCAPSRDHAGKRRGIPDVGPGAARPPGEVEERPDLPQMAEPARSPGVFGGYAGAAGLRLRRAHHPEAVFRGCPVRRPPRRLAGTDPRRPGQPGRAGGEAETVAHSGGNHRLVAPVPVHLRHIGRDFREIRRPGGTPAGGKHPAPDRAGNSEVRPGQPAPIHRAMQP